MKTMKVGSGYAQRGNSCGAHATLMALHQLGRLQYGWPYEATQLPPLNLWHGRVEALWKRLIFQQKDAPGLAAEQNCNPVAVVTELASCRVQARIYVSGKSAAEAKKDALLDMYLSKVTDLARNTTPPVQIVAAEGLDALLARETLGYAIVVCDMKDLSSKSLGLHYVLVRKKLARGALEAYDSNDAALAWQDMGSPQIQFGMPVTTTQTTSGQYKLYYLGMTVVLEGSW